MAYLLFGLVLFFGVHLIPSNVALRRWLIQRLGEYGYKAVFALLALSGLVLLIVGLSRAQHIVLWQPMAWAKTLALALMPLSFILLFAAYIPSNIKRYIRHPMLWGVLLWAAVHLFAVASLAPILLFAAFALYALFDMWSANRRGARLAVRRRDVAFDVIVIGLGLMAYVGMLYLHPHLIGVAVL